MTTPDVITLAKTAIDLRQYDIAIEHCIGALAGSPLDYQLLSMASECCQRLGRFNDALEYSKTICHHHPKAWNGYAIAARSLASLNRSGEAFLILEIGLDKHPDHISLLNAAIDVCRSLGATERSMVFAQTLVDRHPQKWIGTAQLARLLLDAGRAHEATRCLEEALTRHPDQINLLTLLSDAFRAVPDLEQGLLVAKRIMHAFPADWVGYARAAQDCLTLDRLDEASVLVDRGLALHPNQFHLISLAESVHRACGRPEQALVSAQALLRHHQANWLGYVRTASNLITLARIDQALEVLRQGLDRFPDHLGLHLLGVDAQRTRKDHASALLCAERIIERFPDHWIGYGRAVQNLTDLNRHKQARERLEEGLERFPQELPLLQIAVGSAHLAGDLARSLDYAERILAHHPEHQQGYLLVALALRRLRRPAEAEEMIRRGLLLHPHQADLLAAAVDIALVVLASPLERSKARLRAQQLIDHHPRDVRGHTRLIRVLLSEAHHSEAVEAAERGQRIHPADPQLLQLAAAAHRSLDQRLEALRAAQAQIAATPSYPKPYLAAARDLAALNRHPEALLLISSGMERIPGQSDLTHALRRIELLQRHLGGDWARQCPKVSILGNCLAVALDHWLSLNLPLADVAHLAVQNIAGRSEIDAFLDRCDRSSHVLTLPIETGYKGFDDFGSQLLQDRCGKRVYLYVNCYYNCFFPFWHYLKTDWKRDIDLGENPYTPYHDMLALALSTRPKRAELLEALSRPLPADACRILVEQADASMAKAEERSPWLAARVRSEPLLAAGCTFNHPSAAMLDLIYARIWSEFFGFSDVPCEAMDEFFAANVVLPIPEFVWTALSDGWLPLPDQKRPPGFLANSEHGALLTSTIALYQANRWIANLAVGNPTLHRAHCFLDALL